MPQIIAANGINLSVTVQGEGPLVILMHGWPELALSWRHQIPALVAAGYQVVYQALVVILAGLVIYAFLNARRQRLGETAEPVDLPPEELSIDHVAPV